MIGCYFSAHGSSTGLMVHFTIEFKIIQSEVES